MLKRFTRLAGILGVASLGWIAGLGASPTSGGIRWNASQDRVDAEIKDWPLSRVLETIAAATDWQVYVEPDTTGTVSTRFTNLKTAEALRRLLGELNFSLTPQTNGPARFFVYRTTVQGATQLIAGPQKPKTDTGSKPIPNELIITLKPGSTESIEEIARRLGAKVLGRIDGLNAFRLQFENEEAARNARAELEADDDVGSVDFNFAINRPAQIEPLSIGAVPPLSLKPNVSPDIEHPVIALIDTGVAGGKSPIKDFYLESVSVTGEADGTGLSHGEAMAQTILRGLETCLNGPASTPWRILPVDVYGNNPTTTTFDVGRGIYAALASKPTIYNLSLGSDGDTPFLRSLLQQLHNNGAIIVASAGNRPDQSPMYPAAYDSVLSVTAGDSRGRIAPYANRSESVDVIASGANIVQFEGRSFLSTGTSVSAAQMSGMIACILAHNPGMTPGQAEAEVRKRFAFR